MLPSLSSLLTPYESELKAPLSLLPVLQRPSPAWHVPVTLPSSSPIHIPPFSPRRVHVHRQRLRISVHPTFLAMQTTTRPIQTPQPTPSHPLHFSFPPTHLHILPHCRRAYTLQNNTCLHLQALQGPLHTQCPIRAPNPPLPVPPLTEMHPTLQQPLTGPQTPALQGLWNKHFSVQPPALPWVHLTRHPFLPPSSPPSPLSLLKHRISALILPLHWASRPTLLDSWQTHRLLAVQTWQIPRVRFPPAWIFSPRSCHPSQTWSLLAAPLSCHFRPHQRLLGQRSSSKSR